MPVLIDTSVWVAHFKRKHEHLVALLEMNVVLVHPMVVGELACGTLPNPRKKTLGDLMLLQSVKVASLHEVLALIERKKLYGQGCDLVDMHLLASTLITPEAQLWTLDKPLLHLAQQCKLNYQPTVH